MSAWVREGRFECFGCTPGGCVGHESKLIYQDTADSYSYYVDGDLEFSMSLEQKNDLEELFESLE